jgi:hypothetical protein
MVVLHEAAPLHSGAAWWCSSQTIASPSGEGCLPRDKKLIIYVHSQVDLAILLTREFGCVLLVTKCKGFPDERIVCKVFNLILNCCQQCI